MSFYEPLERFILPRSETPGAYIGDPPIRSLTSAFHIFKADPSLEHINP